MSAGHASSSVRGGTADGRRAAYVRGDRGRGRRDRRAGHGGTVRRLTRGTGAAPALPHGAQRGESASPTALPQRRGETGEPGKGAIPDRARGADDSASSSSSRRLGPAPQCASRGGSKAPHVTDAACGARDAAPRGSQRAPCVGHAAAGGARGGAHHAEPVSDAGRARPGRGRALVLAGAAVPARARGRGRLGRFEPPRPAAVERAEGAPPGTTRPRARPEGAAPAAGPAPPRSAPPRRSAGRPAPSPPSVRGGRPAPRAPRPGRCAGTNRAATLQDPADCQGGGGSCGRGDPHRSGHLIGGGRHDRRAVSGADDERLDRYAAAARGALLRLGLGGVRGRYGCGRRRGGRRVGWCGRGLGHCGRCCGVGHRSVSFTATAVVGRARVCPCAPMRW